jgi:hypothetical protein
MFTGGDRNAVGWMASCGAALAVSTTGISGSAWADTVHITGNHAGSSESNSYGGFDGTLTFDEIGGGLAVLTISLQNTAQFGGWLTAIAFDGPAGTSDWMFDEMSSSGLSDGWNDLTGPISVSPFHYRSFGASTSGDWLGGGSPETGLAAGDSATWVFQGSTTGGVSAMDFLTPNDGQNLLFRFRGFSNGASDKLPATPSVPGLGGLAVLAGVGGVRRRRR